MHVVIDVQLTVVAAIDPNLNRVAVLPRPNPVPITVTLAPPTLDPLLGLRLVTVGANLKRSADEIALVPPGVATVTFTVPADSAGDAVVIEVGEFTLKLVALADPNLTVVAPVKLVPVIVTEVPPATGPFFGDSLVTVGGAVELTITLPDIAIPCTKQKYLYVPTFVNVQLPFQLVSPLLIGTPLHTGVLGFPASHTIPCGTTVLVSWNVTVPPGATVTSEGTHMSDSVPLTVGLDSAIAGTTAMAAPSTPANSR